MLGQATTARSVRTANRCAIHGRSVYAYLSRLSDAAVEAMLNELATELGAALGFLFQPLASGSL